MTPFFLLFVRVSAEGKGDIPVRYVEEKGHVPRLMEGREGDFAVFIYTLVLTVS